jgi:hypothetical protein
LLLSLVNKERPSEQLRRKEKQEVGKDREIKTQSERMIAQKKEPRRNFPGPVPRSGFPIQVATGGENEMSGFMVECDADGSE